MTGRAAPDATSAPDGGPSARLAPGPAATDRLSTPPGVSSGVEIAAGAPDGAAGPWILGLVAVAAWAALIVAARLWGIHLNEQGVHLVLPTPPLLGGYRPARPDLIWLPALVGTTAALVLPRLARTLRWSVLLVAAPVTAVAWWAALALVDGPDGLSRGLLWEGDFAAVVPRVAADPGGFLRSFVQDLPQGSVAVRGHPPGFPLLLGLLDRLGLQGPGWAAAVVLAVATLAVAMVLSTVRTVAGEAVARRAAPFVVLAPAALWIAVSPDALFMGVGAVFVALLGRALWGPAAGADRAAALAGLAAAALALLSYGLLLLAVPAVVLSIHRRRFRPLVIAAFIAAAAVLSLVPLGFWYGAGFLATKYEYDTLDLVRPYSFFVVGNLAAWALALGPASAAALARLRDRRLWLLVGGGAGAAALANLTGLSEGEVERIWLPFTLWVLPAGAVLARRVDSPATRAWLAAQVASAVALTAYVQPHW